MKKQLILLLILFFLLNLFWEVSHSLLFDWNQPPLQNNVEFYIQRILFSTFGDLVILTIMFAIISLKNKSWKWINKPSRIDYVLVIILGTIFAIFIEIRASIQGRWHYNQFMPTIFGIGLTPLVQLFTIALLALWLIRR